MRITLDELSACLVLALTVVGVGPGCERGPSSSGAPAASTTSPSAGAWPPPGLRTATVLRDDSLVIDRMQRHHFRETPVNEVLWALTDYQVVEKHKWQHGYSHVAGADEAGWLVLADGTRLKWFLRPGGLAVVQYPDGQFVYLAAGPAVTD